jgi:hypothetical protein
MLRKPGGASRVAKTLVAILGFAIAVFVFFLWNLFSTRELIVIGGMAFAGAGFLVGVLSPGKGWGWGLWLNWCTVAAVALTILRSPVTFLTAPLFLAWTVAVASASAAFGAWLRNSRSEGSIGVLHILFGSIGLVLPKIAHPVFGGVGESWFFTRLWMPIFLVIIFLGIGLASLPRIFKPLVVFVDWGFIALTICVWTFLLLVIKGEQSKTGAFLLFVLAFVMVSLSLFAVLTLYLLSDRNLTREPALE